MCTKVGFSLVPVQGYLPSGNDLEQTNADQIIQAANEEVTLTNREMQVIIQGDTKHPHINKSGSFSRLRSFKLNDMGFSLNKISPITFDVKNSQTSADCGIKGRAPTLTPRERRAPQAHNEGANPNEAHHEPQGNASYNPDESITNKQVQGRFVPPKAGNMSTQPHQQQQSLSEEGSKENTILNGPRHHREGKCSGSSFRPSRQHATGTSPCSTYITNWRTTMGSPSQKSEQKPTGIHQNAMEPPMDTPEHLWMAKAQELLNQEIRWQNFTQELHQVQVMLHNLLTHPRTLLCVQHVAKVATGAEIVLIIISVDFL